MWVKILGTDGRSQYLNLDHFDHLINRDGSASLYSTHPDPSDGSAISVVRFTGDERRQLLAILDTVSHAAPITRTESPVIRTPLARRLSAPLPVGFPYDEQTDPDVILADAGQALEAALQGDPDPVTLRRIEAAFDQANLENAPPAA